MQLINKHENMVIHFFQETDIHTQIKRALITSFNWFVLTL